MATTIRNPLEWGWDQIRHGAEAIETLSQSANRPHEDALTVPHVRQIEIGDFREIFQRAWSDFGAYRTDVFFLVVIYPIIGIVMARMVFGYDMLPLLFPMISGFALIGPFAGLGLYEMSRQRELGVKASWRNAFTVLYSPAIGSIVLLGLILCAVFVMWMATAWALYTAIMGPEQPLNLGAFLYDVLMTEAGWTLIAVGCGTGFLFACLALAISVVSFPLLLDRDVGLGTAIRTSFRAVAMNPVPMAAWGIVVAGALVLGSLPFLAGLIVVMPLLGHATWHLYRKVVRPRL
ncbi:DUF2189 domain-containing protein [Dongia sp.]|uniref:DUF2189 domain-containing protein n=1 Tax=Dongia sp. TaxID=1977262 RepID=UPI0035B38450